MKITSLRDINYYRNLKEYQPVSFNEKIKTSFEILINSNWVNCDLFHVLYEPMIVQITFNTIIDDSYIKNNIVRVFSFNNPNIVNATLELSHIKTIELENEKKYFFEVLTSKLHINYARKIYLRRIYNKSLKKNANFLKIFNFKIYKKLVGLFSVPKQVWLVSIINKTTHFPIDLCALNKEYISIGVRNSNKSMSELCEGNTFYLSQTAAEDYQNVYSLGKFLDNKKKTIDTLKVDEVLIPNIIRSYYKLNLKLKYEFENQTIYISKIIDKKEVSQVKKPLYHLHKIWLLNNSKYVKIEY